MSAPTMPGIKNGWSLREFVNAFGPKIKLANLTNKVTSEQFKAVMVGSDDNWTMVSFSQNLPVMTAIEIAKSANDLRVVLLESGNYSLCKAGENQWEDIVL
jgi:hypothetical protein